MYGLFHQTKMAILKLFFFGLSIENGSNFQRYILIFKIYYILCSNCTLSLNWTTWDGGATNQYEIHIFFIDNIFYCYYIVLLIYYINLIQIILQKAKEEDEVRRKEIARQMKEEKKTKSTPVKLTKAEKAEEDSKNFSKELQRSVRFRRLLVTQLRGFR